MSTWVRTRIRTWVPRVLWSEVVWAKSSHATALPVGYWDTLLVVWTQVLFPTNLLLACQAPELRCSFCWLEISSASQPTSPGHAPGLPWCDHVPLHRGHARGRAQQGMLTTASGRRLLGEGGKGVWKLHKVWLTVAEKVLLKSISTPLAQSIQVETFPYQLTNASPASGTVADSNLCSLYNYIPPSPNPKHTRNNGKKATCHNNCCNLVCYSLAFWLSIWALMLIFLYNKRCFLFLFILAMISKHPWNYLP